MERFAGDSADDHRADNDRADNDTAGGRAMTAGLWRRSDADLLGAITDDAQAMHRTEISSLCKIAELATRDSAPGQFTNIVDHLTSQSTLTIAKARTVVTFAMRMNERPRIFAAVRRGEITKDAATMIVKFLDDPPQAMPADAIDRTEKVLIDYARNAGHNRLAAMIDGIRDHYTAPPQGGDGDAGDGGSGDCDSDGGGSAGDGAVSGAQAFGQNRPQSRGADDTERSSLFVSRTLGNRYAVRGDLDSETGERLVTALSPLSAPRPEPDGTHDRRTAAKRRADGLAEFLRRHSQCDGAATDWPDSRRTAAAPETDAESGAGHVPGSPESAGADAGGARHTAAAWPATGPTGRSRGTGTRRSAGRAGTPGCGQPSASPHDLGGGAGTGTTLSLHIGLRDLADTDDDAATRAGLIADGRFEEVFDNLPHGMTDWFANVTVGAARRLACDAAITPIGVDGRGMPLNVGRARRLASRAQRRALAARDHGCAFPRCDRPPAWCVAHHVWHWADGGPTDLDNLVSLCTEHHRAVHHHGWTVAVDAVEGMPRFLPPAHVRSSSQWVSPDGEPLEPPRTADRTPCRSRTSVT
ncbi:HNH endonuclease signature motif containing protein [Tomitella cavernea]|uniref:HNH nuclease domain-containing protein n=1 Tax=Tomitella cavernea TaxID=1387982 RepID=A0ABP9CG93_9ACTN|nr:HNH endonuclease signature motif containing protein [Tomitella cavernea]